MGKIKSFKEVCRICHKLQKEGKKIVFCHGFFDILHRGHVTLLVEAKKLGDILVVGVDHDDNAKILKGPQRPINDHDSRMYVLANFEPVDYVFLIPSFKNKKELSIYYSKNIYEPLQPDIVATSLRAGKYGEMKMQQANQIGAEFVDINKDIYENRTSKIVEILGLD